MTTANAGTFPCAEGATLREVTARANGAMEEGVRTARRTLRKGFETAEDLRDEAAYRVKREPFKAVGLAFGTGVLLGVVAGWASQKGRRRE